MVGYTNGGRNQIERGYVKDFIKALRSSDLQLEPKGVSVRVELSDMFWHDMFGRDSKAFLCSHEAITKLRLTGKANSVPVYLQKTAPEAAFFTIVADGISYNYELRF